MPDRREPVEDQFGGGLRGGDDAPCPPFAGEAFGEEDVGQIGQVVAEFVIAPLSDAAIDVDDDGAAPFGPVAGGFGGPVEGRVAEHDEAEGAVGDVGHAQFPLDISPRISSCRQLM